MKRRERYTITEIANEIGVTRQTIYYWIKKGWLRPKRDYRNYPVFTKADLEHIKKWQRTLREEKPLPKQRFMRGLPAATASTTSPLTWEEIQKILYKQ